MQPLGEHLQIIWPFKHPDELRALALSDPGAPPDLHPCAPGPGTHSPCPDGWAIIALSYLL